MHKKTRMVAAPCLDCDWEIYLGAHPRQGQKVTCPDCGAELEVVDLDPPALDWASDEFEQDWDPDEEDWG